MSYVGMPGLKSISLSSWTGRTVSKKWCVILLCVFMALSSEAQDTRFSQYYQAPIYLNPAFTGATGQARLGANFRRIGVASKYAYNALSAYGDYYFQNFYASVGLLFVSEHDEYTGYTNDFVAIPVSYDFALNSGIIIKPALELSYTRQSIDFGRLIFSDQIDSNGVENGVTEEALVRDQQGYLDVASGMLIYSETWWIGVAMHHLLGNDISYLSGQSDDLAVRYSLHGGINLDLDPYHKLTDRDVTLMPTFSFISQSDFSQMDLGAIASVDPIMFGLIYRGLPLPLVENDYSALAWIGGVKIDNWTFAYSYDMQFKNAVVATGGIHELSLTFLFDPSNPHATPRSMKRLKCPIPLR